MKNHLSHVVVVLIFFSTTILCCGAIAADTTQIKIGAINMQKVVRKSMAGRKAMEKLNKKVREPAREVKGKTGRDQGIKRRNGREGPLDE